MPAPDPTHGGAPLAGLTVIEMATFVAGPSAGMTLAQLGADVIRIDPLGGAIDVNRWPLADNGRSLYWTSLNRGKRSVAIDVRSDVGRDVVRRMICAAGPDRGIFIDNAVGQDWLSWSELSSRRADLIHVHIEGHRDGSPAVDYTINAEVGLPLITGPEGYGEPVNHVLPAWDLLCGMAAVTAVLAALRRRDRTGLGARIDIALADIALAAVAGLGWFSETVDRQQQGNSLYGGYGREFATRDGRFVMVVALTPHQWRSLVGVTGAADAIASLEATHAVDLNIDESARYRLRHEISDAFAPWFGSLDHDTVATALTGARVLWAPYRTLREAAAAMEGPLRHLHQPGIGQVVSAESPLRFNDYEAPAASAASVGDDTIATLTEVGGIDAAEVAELLAAGVIKKAGTDG